MQISVKITDKVSVGFKKIGTNFSPAAREVLLDEFEQVGKRARGGWPDGGVQGYNVDLRKGQRYKRTGKLGAGANWQLVGSSIRFKSLTSYTNFVIGNAEGAGQVKIHRKRWPIARKVIEDWARSLTKVQKRILSQIFQNMGIGL